VEKLDAYGKCKYTIGTGDDFIALDFLVHPRKRTVEFEAVVNTETGAYCGDFVKVFEVPFAEAYETAVDLCFRARDWCFDGGMTPGRFDYRNPSVQFTMDVDKAVKRAQK
jgi:hypothetical protein